MLLSILENYYNSCTIVHLLKVLNCHFLSSCWIFRIFLFYIIIRNFYLFWILALGILQKPCYIHPIHHLSTWPSLWGCLNAFYSFTLIPPRSLLLSPSAVDLALKKKKKKGKEKKRKSKEKKMFQLLQSSHLFVSVPIHSVFPSVALNEQPVFLLKDVSSTCAPAQAHCSRNFSLSWTF